VTICPRVSAAESLSRSGASTPVLQRAAQLKRHSRAARLPTTRLRSRPGWPAAAKQAGCGADAGADDVRGRARPRRRRRRAQDELRPWARGGQQRNRRAGNDRNPGRVERHQVARAPARPVSITGSEGEQAFWPRAQQQGVIVAVLALGEADRQPVDDPETAIWMGRVSATWSRLPLLTAHSSRQPNAQASLPGSSGQTAKCLCCLTHRGACRFSDCCLPPCES